MSKKRPDRPFIERYRGKWCVVFWENGIRKRCSTGTKEEQVARQALADFEQAYQGAGSAETLKGALTLYLASRKNKVQAYSRLEEACLRLDEKIGYLRLSQINQKIWDDYAATRVKKPNARAKKQNHEQVHVAPGTLRREYNVLRAALNLAVRKDLLTKMPEIEPPQDRAVRDKYVTKQEARKLLDACDTLHLRTFIALAMFTGARKGSILALTWDRVLWEANRIDFQEPDRPLTAKKRSIVPIIPGLRRELEEAYKCRTCEYVVEYNGRPVPYGVRHSFRKLCIRAGLSWQPTAHHFKHSVASWFAMGGVPIDQASDWLATDPRTLRRVYRKFDPSYLESAGAALEL